MTARIRRSACGHVSKVVKPPADSPSAWRATDQLGYRLDLVEDVAEHASDLTGLSRIELAVISRTISGITAPAAALLAAPTSLPDSTGATNSVGSR